MDKSVRANKFFKTAWYRSQAAKFICGGKSKIVYRISTANQKYKFSVFNSAVNDITSKSYNVKL
ncbi:SGNH/GDSL hydrolase family protein, partial [Lentilactobacillus buchneri]